MSMHGDNFYVKTYGPSYRSYFNGYESRDVRKQHWMVYWHKRKIATFDSKAKAEKECKRLNADRVDNITKLKKRIEDERNARLGELTLSAVKSALGSLRATLCDAMAECERLKEKIEKMERRGRA